MSDAPKRWVPKVSAQTLASGPNRKHLRLLEDVQEMAPKLSDEMWLKLVEILRAEKKRRDALA